MTISPKYNLTAEGADCARNKSVVVVVTSHTLLCTTSNTVDERERKMSLAWLRPSSARVDPGSIPSSSPQMNSITMASSSSSVTLPTAAPSTGTPSRYLVENEAIVRPNTHYRTVVVHQPDHRHHQTGGGSAPIVPAPFDQGDDTQAASSTTTGSTTTATATALTTSQPTPSRPHSALAARVIVVNPSGYGTNRSSHQEAHSLVPARVQADGGTQDPSLPTKQGFTLAAIATPIAIPIVTAVAALRPKRKPDSRDSILQELYGGVSTGEAEARRQSTERRDRVLLNTTNGGGGV